MSDECGTSEVFEDGDSKDTLDITCWLWFIINFIKLLKN